MKKNILIFIIISFIACRNTETQKTGLEGKPLPAFSMLLTDSTTWINTANSPTGKPVALFYFRPYCPYCKSQTKEITKEMDKLKNIQFYFITDLPITELKNFCEEYSLSKYSNVVAGMDTANFIMDYFSMSGIPYMAIYDKNKKLNKTFLGKISATQLQKAAFE